MSIIPGPLLRYAAIKELHPTQITVGMREVWQKRKSWRSDGKKKKEKLLGRHLVPVILGPKSRYYIVDHHARDLSGLSVETFWSVLNYRSLIHPFNAEGCRQTYDAIPRSVRAAVRVRSWKGMLTKSLKCGDRPLSHAFVNRPHGRGFPV